MTEGYLAVTDKELLDKYEPVIQEMTAKCPRFWRLDLQQELRCQLLQALRTYNGQLRDLYIRTAFKKIARSFEHLERNRGMTDTPNDFRWDELEPGQLADLEYKFKQFGFEVRHVGHVTYYEKHC